MNNLKEHFKNELGVMRKSLEKDDELLIEPFVKEIEKIAVIFDKLNPNVGLASLTADVIARSLKAVLTHQILSPLNGTEDEWNDLAHDRSPSVWQNNRDFAVFKQTDGRCVYNNGIVWRDVNNKRSFTGVVNGIDSRLQIREFPFMPKTFYIDVVLNDWEDDQPALDIYKNDSFEEDGKKMFYQIIDRGELIGPLTYYKEL